MNLIREFLAPLGQFFLLLFKQQQQYNNYDTERLALREDISPFKCFSKKYKLFFYIKR